MAIGPVPHPLRILVVDDEPEQLRLLARWLAMAHEVTPVDRVDGALQLLASHEFDVVISDNRMPGGSGVDLLTRIAADHPRVLRVMHSGSRPEPLDTLAATGVIQHFITKPGHRDLVTLCADHQRRARAER